MRPRDDGWRCRILVGVAVAGLLLAPSGPARAQPQTGPHIEIKAHGYGIPELAVQPGTTVTWINHDDDPHTVTSTENVFRSPGIDTDETYSYTFTKPGKYVYYCSIHKGMAGEIDVTP